MTLALLIALEAFRVFQYAPKNVTLRGCSECRGEPDDVCEVRGGAQVRPIEEYAPERWAAPDRLKLLRARADPDCAVSAKAFFGPRGGLELAAIRMASAAPSAAAVARVKSAVNGWPRLPSRRKPAKVEARPDRGALRLAVVCWPSEQGWPAKAAPDAKNACEEWLLPVKADGEPDLAAASFLLGPSAATAAVDEQPEAAPVAKAEPAAAPAPQPKSAACGEPARSRTATLERFEQWEDQVRGARKSLDRNAWTVDAAAWSGHCQELEVLHAALEQQLGCAVAEQGRCAP